MNNNHDTRARERDQYERDLKNLLEWSVYYEPNVREEWANQFEQKNFDLVNDERALDGVRAILFGALSLVAFFVFTFAMQNDNNADIATWSALASSFATLAIRNALKFSQKISR